VPVIIVGNVTAGGTGKTPLVIWLAQTLGTLGYRPGIVLRGYGGDRQSQPVLVADDATPEAVGDEALLLAGRSGCPVVVCRDRVAAVRHLLEVTDASIVIADDGLQHYALARDLELIVVDGSRGAGNGRLLPAGPLREPLSRLEEVDWVLATGGPSGLHADETVVRTQPLAFVSLGDDAPERIGVEAFSERHRRVRAVAGIGNPQRFADTLRQLGLEPLLTPFPDHHRFEPEELDFGDGLPVVCTEKDAVKLRRLDVLPAQCWYLEVAADPGPDARDRLVSLLQEHGVSR
jgi:tetraacyldisaccharide 4'-kinase